MKNKNRCHILYLDDPNKSHASYIILLIKIEHIKTDANNSEQLRIAFDGDAVLFSDESERIFQEQGYEAFINNEKQAAQ